jgi:hypothetical protein
MERLIGDLGREIRSDTHPYSNLSQRALVRAQVNSLKAMLPDLDPDRSGDKIPQYSVSLPNGYVLLRA